MLRKDCTGLSLSASEPADGVQEPKCTYASWNALDLVSFGNPSYLPLP